LQINKETKDHLLSSFKPQHPQKAQDHARIKTPQKRQKFAPKIDCLLDKNETASPTKEGWRSAMKGAG
jgi:hypothetical protein